MPDRRTKFSYVTDSHADHLGLHRIAAPNARSARGGVRPRTSPRPTRDEHGVNQPPMSASP